MGKPRDKLHKSKGKDAKKGENSAKSLRTRKTDWPEQSGIVENLERPRVSESGDEEDSGKC